NHTTSKEWLINYSVQKSLTFPILYDASGIYDEYQIGFGYGNIMPNWLVVDRYGKIHTRYDGDLGIVAQIKEIIISLIDQ
ncbi:MAG: hypothetical protein GY863_03140, partial [bacterium]|nr:hypothetical protein [bacterium]